VITAVPVASLQNEAIGMLAPFGRLCLFAGLPKGTGDVPLDTNAIHYKNLYVTGMTGGAPRDYRDALKLIGSKKIDVSRVVSHVCPLNEVAHAYDLAVSGKGMKIVLGSAKLLKSVREARFKSKFTRDASTHGPPAPKEVLPK